MSGDWQTECPVPGAKGHCNPDGIGTNGVLILGEAMGEAELKDSLPFRPWAPAGSVLDRAIRRCGFQRDQFVIYNAVPVHPPKNYLDGAPYEGAAIAWGRPYVESVVNSFKPRCILALGNVALRATAGIGGISVNRGYPIPSQYGIPVVGALHPSFLRRGEMSSFSVLMHDIKLAVAVAAGGGTFFSPVVWRDMTIDISDLVYMSQSISEPFIPPGYVTHPNEADAWAFLERAARAKWLAYDIETPRSTVATEDDSDELGDTEILSIQFSTARETGIFMPWRQPFVEIAKRILALPVRKANCNGWRFDDPILTAHGAEPKGEVHDIRWAWRHLQPDLRAGLQFITSFYSPECGPWKHLHASHPEFYGIRDCDALMRIIE